MEETGTSAEIADPLSLKIITPECAKKMLISGSLISFDMNHRVLDLLQGKDAHCPECETKLENDRQRGRYYSLQRISCPVCHKQPTATKGTILHNAQIKPEELFIIAILSACNESNKFIGSRINKSPDTVRDWRNMMEVLTPVYD